MKRGARPLQVAREMLDRHLVRRFVAHYHDERYHQGIGGRLIKPQRVPANENGDCGRLNCRSRLGGTLNYYHRAAA